MAEVFKAKSFGVEGFEKTLVVKRILPEIARSPGFADVFVAEAKLAVRLSHANIVQVIDLGSVGDGPTPTYFIAMEYVAGLDLGSLLLACRRTGATLPIGLCIYIAAEAAKGLDHAHRRRDEQMRPLGIVHRDVCPHNVLLSWEGEVKLSDFGISRAHGTNESREDPGTIAYRSPEIVRGEPASQRSDLFSLGTVLYETLTGTSPFAAPTASETRQRILRASYPPIESLRSGVAPDLAALIGKALALSRDDRFPDAGRMYEDLIAHLYVSGDRFGANDLSSLLARFREKAAQASIKPEAMLLGDSIVPPHPEPIEITGKVDSTPPGPGDAVDLASLGPSPLPAIGMADHRDVTALVVVLGGTNDAAIGDQIASTKQVVTRYGGIVLAENPTEVAALFGLGQTDGRDTESAIRCGMVAMRSLSATAATTSGGAGVHTGRVLVRAGGSLEQDDRLAALFATARDLARLRPPYTGVSVTAAKNVRGLFVFEEPDVTGRPIATSGLIASDTKPAGEGLGRFIGRKAELRRIGELLSLANRGRAQLLTLRGVTGIGKTRLLVETNRRLRRGQHEVGFHMASCPPSGSSVSLSGLTAMLQVLCGVREGDPPSRALEVEPRLRALGLHDEEVGAVLFQLGAPHHRGASIRTLRAGFVRMIGSLCADKLHVFAWDDAQSLDKASAKVIDDTVRQLAGARCVFAVSSRETMPHGVLKHADSHLIDVVELNEEEAADLVAWRAGVRHAPPDLVRFCRERAGGHPLFLGELVKELLENGAVAIAGGAVAELKLAGEIAVPRSLRALIASRMERLPAAERTLLQAAAVIGEPTDLAVLGAMLRQMPPDLDKNLGSLERRGLVRRTANTTMTFSSPLLGEVIVDMLTEEARRAMHREAAAACEAVFGSLPADHADRLAVHFLEAGDPDRAASSLSVAAKRKLVGQDHEGAARDLSRAFELCDLFVHPAADLADWLDLLATAARRTRSVRNVDGLAGPVIDRIDADGDLTARVSARMAIANILVWTHDFEGADRQLAVVAALAEDNPSLLRPAILTEAEIARRRGNYRRALLSFEALSLTSSDDPAEDHQILMGLALSHAANGERERALESLDRAARLLPTDDVVHVAERARMDLLVRCFTRDFEGAVDPGMRAVELARHAGLPYEVAVALHLLGEVLLRLGDLPRAYAMLQQSSSVCEEIGDERLRMHNRSFLSYLDALRGKSGADGALEESVAYASAHGFAWDEADGRYLLAGLHRHYDDTNAARIEYERCRSSAQAMGYRFLAEDCDRALGDLAPTGL
jgi:serine/threonine protein kinase/tetratricopeptide (TPR) repeat protein